MAAFSHVPLSADEEMELYDFSRTIGLITFTADGKEYSLLSGNGDVDGSERGGVGLLVGPIQNYYYMMNEPLREGIDLEITDEIYFFSYDDELTLFIGEYWISDGINFIEIAKEDYQVIQRWRGVNSRNPIGKDIRGRYARARREDFGAELEAARKLKIQGYEVEEKFDEILKKEGVLSEAAGSPEYFKPRDVPLEKSISEIEMPGPKGVDDDKKAIKPEDPNIAVGRSKSIDDLPLLEEKRAAKSKALERGWSSEVIWLFAFGCVVLVVSLKIVFTAISKSN